MGHPLLWFAWKFVPLWYQQQHRRTTDRWWVVVICLKIRTFVVSATTRDRVGEFFSGCDLLENSYLCGISNNLRSAVRVWLELWFAWKFVPLWYQQQPLTNQHLLTRSCDLLENSYLCGISNNLIPVICRILFVVICLKIRTFVVSATTISCKSFCNSLLWFAWKFVPLWYQQQRE